LKLDLNSNSFIENHAYNGGALYLIGNNVNSNNKDKSIIIQHNTFEGNKAENFGGAIYSDYNKLYLAQANNNTIINNIAYIMGGGVYAPNSVNEKLFNLNTNNIVNNTYNDYASKPAYITLNEPSSNRNISLISGEWISINFTLYDEFDKKYEDRTKYYSSMTVRVALKEKKEDIEDDGDLNYHLMGNIGSFNNGILFIFFYFILFYFFFFLKNINDIFIKFYLFLKYHRDM